MQFLQKSLAELQAVGRWDIDFHLPPEGIKAFSENILCRVDMVADIIKVSWDPTKRPDELFHYVDISSVDPVAGEVIAFQELLGSEAPSRARKVVDAFDIIVSTVRPTRGAVAVVPVNLHKNIVSTGFTVIRAKKGVNPFYLQYVLRLDSTLEQFRKWSTGSSYPAILDEDVAKTKIPILKPEKQDEIAIRIIEATQKRKEAIKLANQYWHSELEGVLGELTNKPSDIEAGPTVDSGLDELLEFKTISQIEEKIATLYQEDAH